MFPTSSLRQRALFLVLALAVSRTAGAQETVPQVRPQAATRTSLGVDAGQTRFSDSTADWSLAAVSLGRRGAAGSATARVTVARRFGLAGAQYEGDLYPSLGGTRYGYLNVGYSPASIFPEWRVGGEVFTGLPQAYEASLGFRHLRFPGDPVTLITGSVGKYTGNYWLSLRPYVRSRAQALTASASLTARRYGETSDDYEGARVGYGTTPGDQIVASELTRNSSLTAGIHASRHVTKGLLSTWALNYEHETLNPTRSRHRVEFVTGVRVDL